MESKKMSSIIFTYFIIFIFAAFSVHAAQSAVNLRTAGNFVILAKSGISTTGATSIVGNIGVSPSAATFITGFGLTQDSSNQFSASSLLNGKIYASNYAPPTPAVMTTAIGDMETAYSDAAGRTLPDYTELGAGNIGGMTLAPGLYKWGTGVTIPTDVTLSGSSTDVWVFQIAQTLDISNGKKVILSGGAQAKNIFWQVAGQATLGTTSVFNGVILGQTAIVLNTGATLNGRALAQTAVTLDASAVTSPSASPSSTLPSNTISPPEPVVCTDCAAPPLNCNYEGGSCQTCGTLVCDENNWNGDGDVQIIDNGDAQLINNGWNCEEWSSCNSEGVQTKKCTLSGSTTTSLEEQSCTSSQKTVVTQTVVTSSVQNQNQNQNANNLQQSNGQITGEVVSETSSPTTNWLAKIGKWESQFAGWISHLFS